MSETASHRRLVQLLSALSRERRTRIADVGARAINVNPYAPLVSAGAADVWGFEPAKDAFADLTANQTAREHFLPYAIGDGQSARFNICRGGGFSSLLRPDIATLNYLGRWHRMMSVVKQVPLKTWRLDDIEELPRVDLVKIDVQGGELAVLQGGRDKLSEAVAVITEVAFLPLYQDQPTLADQMAELADQGFVLHKFLHQSARILLHERAQRLARRQHRNQLIDGDAVFIRDPRASSEFSDEQLKHLAILADTVFHSHDLALLAVDELVNRGEMSAKAADEYARALPGQ